VYQQQPCRIGILSIQQFSNEARTRFWNESSQMWDKQSCVESSLRTLSYTSALVIKGLTEAEVKNEEQRLEQSRREFELVLFYQMISLFLTAYG
jgi:hypothetical protein